MVNIENNSQKKLVLGIYGTIVLLAFLVIAPIYKCEDSKLINVTKNISYPFSTCEISGSTINCYNSIGIKEVVVPSNVTVNKTCSVIK